MPSLAYERHKKWAAKNPGKRRVQKQRWYRKNAERIRVKNAGRQDERVMANREYYKKYPEKLHARTLKFQYGMTIEDYKMMLERQNGRCVICQIHYSECRDHCHVTEKVRGLLCEHCNRMLGLARDRPDVLIAGAHYLAKTGGDSAQH